MAGVTTKFLIVLSIFASSLIISTVANNEGGNNLLDVETPAFFNYNSPLQRPGSLNSRPYYDFLSTLYRRDAAKSDLFRPYGGGRARRDVAPVLAAATAQSNDNLRERRAIVFRPLFVYKQQEIKKTQLQAERKRV